MSCSGAQSSRLAFGAGQNGDRACTSSAAQSRLAAAMLCGESYREGAGKVKNGPCQSVALAA